MPQPTFNFLARSAVTPDLDRQMDILFKMAFKEFLELSEPETAGVEWADSHEWFILGWMDAELVTQLCLLTRQILVGGEQVWVFGVGGVATHPRWQHQGFASALLRVTEEFARQEIKVPFGLLVCGDDVRPLYERAGWRYVADELFYEQKGERRLMRTPVMILPLTQQNWPAGEIDLCGSPW